MSAISACDYDSVTAEVIGSRIRSSVSEAAITIVRTSGSPVITESQDFSTALFDADGEHVGYSGYVVTHIGSSLVGVQSVMRDFPRDELRRGDQFICNCPSTTIPLIASKWSLFSRGSCTAPTDSVAGRNSPPLNT